MSGSEHPGKDNPEQQQRAEKTRQLAILLFPGEEWVEKEPNIYVAASRLDGGHKEQTKLDREISHVRLLTNRGSVAYFLPGQESGEDLDRKYPDTIIDGAIVELKGVSGNRTTLGKSFKRGYKQGLSLITAHSEIAADHSVFLRLFTPVTPESVRAKLAGELKNTTDKGRCICYFESTEELYSWSYSDLRSIIRA
jgi:hypothetical protein